MSKFIAGTLNIIPYLFSKFICKNKDMKLNVLTKGRPTSFNRNDYIIFFLIISIYFIIFL